MERRGIPLDPRHLGVLPVASKWISEPIVLLMQTLHLSCVKISTISKWTELSLEPRHLWVPSGASKMISEPMVRLTQTVPLSCNDTNTVSKRKEVRFHLTHVTYEFNQVCPKWCPSLWYVRRKSCTYHAPTLTLSKNRKKSEIPHDPHHLGA
jgi:hypothetical protein